MSRFPDEARAELWVRLKAMTVRKRLRFVEECCEATNRGKHVKTRVLENTTGTAQEAYADLMFLCFNYNLDPATLLGRLTAFNRS